MEEIIGMTTINIFLASVIMMASAWWLSLTIRTAQTLAQRQSMTNDCTNTLLKGSLRSSHAHKHGINQRTS